MLLEIAHAFNLDASEKAIGLSLANNKEFLQKFLVVALCKNHNQLGQVDQFMRQFAKLCMDLPDKRISQNLEQLLNAEISVQTQGNDDSSLLKDYKSLPNEIDPLLLAQPAFPYLPTGMKLLEIQKYLDLIKEQDRTREAINFLKQSVEIPEHYQKLTSNFDTLFALVKELDSEQTNQSILLAEKHGTIEKMKKVSGILNEHIEQAFLKQYGIRGIQFHNMEDVYSHFKSGHGSMAETRKWLLKNGMSVQFAD